MLVLAIVALVLVAALLLGARAGSQLATGHDAQGAASTVPFARGAEREEEIGGIVDFHQRQMGNPAVLFDDIPGYPKGHRVLSNLLTSVPRINLALGLKADASEMDLIGYWREYMKEAPTVPPREVNGGPLTENVAEGDAVEKGQVIAEVEDDGLVASVQDVLHDPGTDTTERPREEAGAAHRGRPYQRIALRPKSFSRASPETRAA